MSSPRPAIIWTALLLLLSASELLGQFSRDPLTNYVMRRAVGLPTIGDHVATLVTTQAEYSAIKEELSGRITVAREAFFRLYPDKPGFAEARAELARYLKDKDQYYVWARSTMRNDPLLALLDKGEVDNGIWRYADSQFEAWRQAFLKNLGAGTTRLFAVLFDRNAAKQALQDADPLYQEYLVVRDWEEFRNRKLVPPGVTPAMWRLALAAIAMDQSEPYRRALLAAEQPDQFAARCATDVPRYLRVESIPPTACACLQRAFEAGSPASNWYLHTNFTEDIFLVASVSGIGIKERVAACLR